MSRFQISYRKSIEAIDYVASRSPGITQYYLSKVLFFADREHVLDYGRPISGDRYIAMEHGPVPSAVRDIIRPNSGYPDDVIDMLFGRVRIDLDGNKQHVYSLGNDQFPSLSRTDIEYLSHAVDTYADMSFGELREESHRDLAWRAAWDQLGAGNEMDIALWMDVLADPAEARDQLANAARCGVLT